MVGTFSQRVSTTRAPTARARRARSPGGQATTGVQPWPGSSRASSSMLRSAPPAREASDTIRTRRAGAPPASTAMDGPILLVDEPRQAGDEPPAEPDALQPPHAAVAAGDDARHDDARSAEDVAHAGRHALRPPDRRVLQVAQAEAEGVAAAELALQQPRDGHAAGRRPLEHPGLVRPDDAVPLHVGALEEVGVV